MAGTPWAVHGTTTAWSTTGETPTTMDALSTEYYEVGITWTHGDPTTHTVDMTLLPLGTEPTNTDWHPAEWATNAQDQTVARLLIGPDGGTIAPVPGRYRTWVRITASPETAILSTAPFDIS